MSILLHVYFNSSLVHVLYMWKIQCVCSNMQVIVGVHNDESYFKLKKKKPIDNTERRMENVKKYADQVSTKEYV